jgi:hypothetical protein
MANNNKFSLRTIKWNRDVLGNHRIAVLLTDTAKFLPWRNCVRKLQSHSNNKLKDANGSLGVKDKGLPQKAEVALGVPGRLKPRIFLTFGTTRVVGRQPYAPAAFTPGEIPGTHF